MTRFNREEWGARSAGPGPGRLEPADVEGIALHWPGIKRPIRGVERVKLALRAWQRFHMDTHGWSDIAYQEAIDQDGNTYLLRGLRDQSAANGDEDVNERFGALLLVLGPNERPSDAMIAATRRRIAAHRRIFIKSRRIVGHRQIRPGGTDCPGRFVRALISAGAFEPEENDRD